jgi:hypothetical protein
LEKERDNMGQVIDMQLKADPMGHLKLKLRIDAPLGQLQLPVHIFVYIVPTFLILVPMGCM